MTYTVDLIAAALLIKDQRLLVIKRKDRAFGEKYSIPGGHVQAEEAPTRALRREIREELGIRIKKPKFLNQQNLFINNKQMVSLNFLAEPADPKIKVNEEEITEAKWVPIKKSKELTESVNALIELIQGKENETKKSKEKEKACKKNRKES